MQKSIILLATLGLLFSCSPKIRSILEYQKSENEFLLRKSSEFDKNGNMFLIKEFGNQRSNRIIETDFKNNRRVFEKSCDYFKEQDTCVLRTFSIFEFDKNSGIEKQTLFEADSAVRFIREIKRLKNMEIKKVYSWEFNPTQNPDREDALILTDTTYYDNKGRKVKRIHFNDREMEPWVELYTYHGNKYTKQTIGTTQDTTLTFPISDLQKIANKKKVEYIFSDSENYKYEFKYY